jgi:hypothetical protein
MRFRVYQLPPTVRPFVRWPLHALRNVVTPFAIYWWRKLRGVECTFDLGGRSYRYFRPLDRTTRRCERVVELPIAWEKVRVTDPSKTLEVGAVMANYYPVRHLVLDKYERMPGVVNEDVVDYSPPERYDLIVSISTLEHVGWDPPEPRDPSKLLRAIENLRCQLTDGGELLVTLPRGWNSELDRLISEGRIPFAERRCMKRVSADNRWEEVDCAALEQVAYGTPFEHANGITIGRFRKE